MKFIILLLLIAYGEAAYYLPGVTPNTFQQDDMVFKIILNQPFIFHIYLRNIKILINRLL